MLSNLENFAANNNSTLKGQVESQDAVIKRIQSKLIDTESLRDDFSKALEIREKKVDNLNE